MEKDFYSRKLVESLEKDVVILLSYGASDSRDPFSTNLIDSHFGFVCNLIDSTKLGKLDSFVCSHRLKHLFLTCDTLTPTLRRFDVIYVRFSVSSQNKKIKKIKKEIVRNCMIG